jgi:hypothetical protein
MTVFIPIIVLKLFHKKIFVWIRIGPVFTVTGWIRIQQNTWIPILRNTGFRYGKFSPILYRSRN